MRHPRFAPGVSEDRPRIERFQHPGDLSRPGLLDQLGRIGSRAWPATVSAATSRIMPVSCTGSLGAASRDSCLDTEFR
jgi:hypothetical protein